MKRILVTGFEAFGGESVNPTAQLVERLKAGKITTPPRVEVRGLLLPVTFGEAFAVLESEIRDFDPDVVLAFGQAGGRKRIEVERIAINCLHADIPDNRGIQVQDRPITLDGREAYFTTLPMRELVQALQAANLSAGISNSAGTYVCNDLFYRLMEMNLHTRRRSGFIHVPYLPEQVANKPGTPSMSIEDLSKGLEVILQTV